MGDKSFITRPPFHEKFQSTITRPNGKLDRPILAPALTSNYQLVGIAFDYLLRFYLERTNIGSQTSLWAAEEGVILLDALEGTSDRYEKAKFHLDAARNLYQAFIHDGLLTDELIAAALCLAHLEGSRRSGLFNEADLETCDERDIADLRQLMSLVREQDFSSRKGCYLNPTFGSACSNTDLILDDKLIDIKTTKYLVLDRRHLHQLVQYYILLRLEGIDVGERRIDYFEEVCEVNQVCIYFSRHGYLHVMKIGDLINPEKLAEFVKWYIEATRPLENDRLAYCRKSYGLVPKGIVKEIQAARRLKHNTPSKKKS